MPGIKGYSTYSILSIEYVHWADTKGTFVHIATGMRFHL